jgi:hypothetical protein
LFAKLITPQTKTSPQPLTSKKVRLVPDGVPIEIRDDKDGFYLFRVGERISHYEIVSSLGKGVFGVVVKAVDTRPEMNNREVAIKIIVNNELMLFLNYLVCLYLYI